MGRHGGTIQDTIPDATASRGEWFDYAVSTGHHPESVEDFTRDELRELFK